MIQSAISRLQYLCKVIPPLLKAITEKDFNEKRDANSWGKKEILGHLIDSAANNHQRFIRGQFEPKPSIAYDQNKWEQYNFYQQTTPAHIIGFWEVYNLHLLHVIKHIPQQNLQLECVTNGTPFTLGFLINDYVAHLEHHLKQIVAYQ